MLKYFSQFIFVSVVLISCQKQENAVETIQYPNQDAPLALLMRDMFLDLEQIKEEITDGNKIKSYLKKHQELLTAKPTDPKVKTEQFNTMGMAYLANLRALEESSEEALLDNYKSVVSTCLACHTSYCPGPVKRINLLKLD
ncbi:hypothetical protein SAMN06295967_10584 [Belliella buryatensis]|uniref:Cytochrome C n=1 Tax=Belliella buryatensis TaxID=1500549 RepID=A0A239CJP5_9BACT|nr:hypothetical protein [Belliella buryatensis]SNS20340.1 hypothetical protein SAMN06295967_10584 [Belliella buryatensis]